MLTWHYVVNERPLSARSEPVTAGSSGVTSCTFIYYPVCHSFPSLRPVKQLESHRTTGIRSVCRRKAVRRGEPRWIPPCTPKICFPHRGHCSAPCLAPRGVPGLGPGGFSDNLCLLRERGLDGSPVLRHQLHAPG